MVWLSKGGGDWRIGHKERTEIGLATTDSNKESCSLHEHSAGNIIALTDSEADVLWRLSKNDVYETSDSAVEVRPVIQSQGI